MTTIPLDTDSLLAEAGDAAWDGLPGGTNVGHVHLCVGDIDEMVGFYRDKLGMGVTAHRPEAMAAFLSAGGYHHHVGGNTWETRGAEHAPEGTARLLRFTIVLPDDDGSRARGRAGRRYRGHATPPGTALVLVAA